MEKKELHIRRLSDNESVRDVDVTGKGDRQIERTIRGVLRKLNTEEFYVDDTEIDDVEIDDVEIEEID